jgi:CheY-like chemotaxis protein
MLEHQGAHVVAVGSVQEALTILENFPVDVLLCCLRWPDGDGGQVLQALRSSTLANGLAAVAIALTTDSSDRIRDQAIAQGFQVCLTKPVEAETLMNAISLHLRRE